MAANRLRKDDGEGQNEAEHRRGEAETQEEVLDGLDGEPAARGRARAESERASER